MTLSFYARVSSGTLGVTPFCFQVFGTGGSSPVFTGGTGVTVTTSWQRFAATITVPSIAGKTIGTNNFIGIQLTFPNQQTFTIDISAVQFEEGDSASPFEIRQPALDWALALRYFWRLSGAGATWYLENALQWGTLANGYGVDSHVIAFPTVFRAAPTMTHNITGFSTPSTSPPAATEMRIWNHGSAVWLSQSTVSINVVRSNAAYSVLRWNGVNSAGAGGDPCQLQLGSDTYFDFSAEL